MKQNMNALFAMLVSFGAIAIFALLGIVCGLFIKPNLIFIILIGILFLIISAPVGSAYAKYAEKKIPIMQ